MEGRLVVTVLFLGFGEIATCPIKIEVRLPEFFGQVALGREPASLLAIDIIERLTEPGFQIVLPAFILDELLVYSLVMLAGNILAGGGDMSLGVGTGDQQIDRSTKHRSHGCDMLQLGQAITSYKTGQYRRREATFVGQPSLALFDLLKALLKAIAKSLELEGTIHSLSIKCPVAADQAA